MAEPIRGNLHPSYPQEMIVQSLNHAIDNINRSQRTTLLRDGAGTQRYLIGYQKNGWGVDKNFGIKVSKPGIDVLKATDSQLVYKDDFSTRTYYDEEGARVALGLLNDGSYGMRVSQEGADVSMATSENLVFNSDNNLFKIVDSGTANVVVPDPIAAGASVVTTVAHNLGYKPAFMGFVTVPPYSGYSGAGQLTNVPSFIIGTIGSSFGQILLRSGMRVDENNLYCEVVNEYQAGSTPGLGGTWEFKYYILQETAN